MGLPDSILSEVSIIFTKSNMNSYTKIRPSSTDLRLDASESSSVDNLLKVIHFYMIKLDTSVEQVRFSLWIKFIQL